MDKTRAIALLDFAFFALETQERTSVESGLSV
jgi:hypothetical protein